MSNLTLRFEVQNQTIHYIEENEVVADSRRYLYAQFSFSGDWKNPKYALFHTGDESPPVQVLLDRGNGCYVPSEVISRRYFMCRFTAGKR